MKDSAQISQRILQWVYLLVLVLLTATVLLLTYLVTTQNASRDIHGRIEGFHLPGLQLAADLERDARDLRDQNIAGSDGLAPNLDGLMYAIRRELGRLEALHRRHPAPVFDDAAGRAVAHFENLEALFGRGHGGSDLRESLDSFLLVMRQLNRLHAISADQQTALLTTHGGRQNRDLWIAILATVLLAGFLVWRIIVLIRNNLALQRESAQKLQDSQRRVFQLQRVEALGQLVGGVAHDFNNLLMAIGGNVQLLQFADLTENHRRELDQIQLATDRAAALTRHLLAFSRQQPIKLQAVNVHDFLQEILPMLRRVIGDNIQFSLQTAPATAHVKADPGHLSQVIMNLVINGRDAMPDGGTLKLSADIVDIGETDTATPDLPPGSYVRIRIEDSGCGMDADVRDRIFEPFFTTKPRGEGTGLGLSTALGIVQMSGGDIIVESQTGRGTRMDVRLPRIAAGGNRPEPEKPLKEVTGGSESVLLVEDDRQIRTLLTARLRQLGYQVHAAANGAEALELCADLSCPIELMVSDIIMPGLNGMETYQRARELRPKIRVVFISGYTDDVIVESGISGIDYPLLHKPLDMDHLAAVMRDTLDRSVFDG